MSTFWRQVHLMALVIMYKETQASQGGVLQEMHKTMPHLNMPQYEDNLVSNGVAYVNMADGISEDFFVDIVGKGREVDSDSDKENEDSTWHLQYKHTPECGFKVMMGSKGFEIKYNSYY
ncbi:hypothetical protein EDC04DRAFT_2600945 [Pisolithus marmoratus]|nr:hypothetical protein EDC04DRAFT_2600945 [Pisolithus marmoratus]